MIIKGSIDINKPRAEVVAVFSNPKYNGEYQDGFVKKELVEGEEGAIGAVYQILYKQSGRDMELTETITNNQLPDLYESNIHHEHMDNTMKVRFIVLDSNTTRYEYEYVYTRINWIMPRLMAILFPSMFRKPPQKWLRQFKEFVEKQ